MSKKAILSYVKNQYETLPDYPFKGSPTTAVLRHKRNRKWYGVIMTISGHKLGIENDQLVDVIGIKLAPELIDILRGKDGYFSAYHMNKEHWLSILLDGSVPSKEICALLDDSYDLTK